MHCCSLLSSFLQGNHLSLLTLFADRFGIVVIVVDRMASNILHEQVECSEGILGASLQHLLYLEGPNPLRDLLGTFVLEERSEEPITDLGNLLDVSGGHLAPFRRLLPEELADEKVVEVPRELLSSRASERFPCPFQGLVSLQKMYVACSSFDSTARPRFALSLPTVDHSNLWPFSGSSSENSVFNFCTTARVERTVAGEMRGKPRSMSLWKYLPSQCPFTAAVETS
jgi:hypothetical protein